MLQSIHAYTVNLLVTKVMAQASDCNSAFGHLMSKLIHSESGLPVPHPPDSGLLELQAEPWPPICRCSCYSNRLVAESLHIWSRKDGHHNQVSVLELL
jgi:hypothetical protein